MTAVKSRSSRWVTPGQPTADLVKMLSKYESCGSRMQLVVIRIAPGNLGNSWIWLCHAVPQLP